MYNHYQLLNFSKLKKKCVASHDAKLTGVLLLFVNYSSSTENKLSILHVTTFTFIQHNVTYIFDTIINMFIH